MYKLVNLKKKSDILIPKVFGGIDTSNILANAPYNAGEKTYTATQDCIMFASQEHMWVYQSKTRINDVPITLREGGGGVYCYLLKKGQTITLAGANNMNCGYIVFGIKY